MSRWKHDEPSPATGRMRDWLRTPGGKAYKERRAANSYMKEWRLKNRKKSKESQQRSYDKIRLECLQQYSGLEVPECRCCAEKLIAFLHLDHVKSDGAEFRKKWQETHSTIAGGTGLYYWLKKSGWPDIGLQVLCANCNLGKRKKAHCPHELIRGHDLDGNSIPDEVRGKYAAQGSAV